MNLEGGEDDEGGRLGGQAARLAWQALRGSPSLGGGQRAGVGRGEGGGSGPARGRAALRLPAPGPPLRGAILQAAVAGTVGCGGYCGAEARRQDGSPAICSQVRAGPPRPPPGPGAAPAGPGREGPAAPTRPARHGPRALSAARPAPPHPGPFPGFPGHPDRGAPGCPATRSPAGSPGAQPCLRPGPPCARALRPRRGEASGVPPRTRSPPPPPRPSARAAWGRSPVGRPQAVRAGISVPPVMQGHQEGQRRGVPFTFLPFFYPTVAAPSNFRSSRSDPRAFLSGQFPGGRRPPCCHLAGKRNCHFRV